MSQWVVNSQFRTREFHRKGLRERIVGLPLLPPLPTLSTQAEFSQNINHHQHLRQTRQSMAEKKYKKRVIQESSSSSSDEGVPLVSPSLPSKDHARIKQSPFATPSLSTACLSSSPRDHNFHPPPSHASRRPRSCPNLSATAINVLPLPPCRPNDSSPNPLPILPPPPPLPLPPSSPRPPPP